MLATPSLLGVAPDLAAPTAPLGVGVTGHRLARLEGVDLSALAARVAEAIGAIGAAAAGPCRLVSSLAEGADAIAADAALAAGWLLDAVLPFAREEYARDFADRGAALATQLAAAQAVFELPGSRHEAGGDPAAYERAGRIMLAQSDLLIALWDGHPPAGRGGTAQIVAEAVAAGVPVLRIDPAGASAPTLLWAGLDAHEWGPETVDTVARGGLEHLPRLVARLAPPVPRAPPAEALRRRWRPLALAFPLLLAVTGVRRLRRADFRSVAVDADAPLPTACAGALEDDLSTRLRRCLAPGFARADAASTSAAQLFRGAYVSNFTLAAVAVILSLLGFGLPPAAKPLLLVGEFAAIATILLVTRTGGRADWHRRWLENRRLAERLRCLQVSARLGELGLRSPGDEAASPATAAGRDVARAIALPSARVDAAYLLRAHGELVALLSDQIGYLTRESGRMHRLEHRLHRLGTWFFVVTASVCVGLLLVKIAAELPGVSLEPPHALLVWLGIAGAALPTLGAAIYGIRMQGEFAGIAGRNAALAGQLERLRRLAEDESPAFDTLWRLARRTAELLAQDVTSWFQTYSARPLQLPG